MYETGGSNTLLAGILAFALWMLMKILAWRTSRKRLLELAALIPGPPGGMILGNAESFMAAPSVIFRNVLNASNKFKNVMKMWIGHRLLVFIINPQDIELVLGSQEHIDKAPEYKFFKPWLGDGLLISTGDKWRAHRKLIAPTFHLNILKTFIALFNRNSRDAVEKLASEVGKEFDCHDYMSETTVEILLETAMGVNKTANKSGYDYAMAVMKMCDILHLRQTKLWLRPDILFNLSPYGRLQKKLLRTIHGLTRKVLMIRKAEHDIGNFKTSNGNLDKQESNESSTGCYSFGKSAGLYDDIDDDTGEKKRMAFLDLLITSSEQGAVLTNEEIQNQVDTIMFEGHDTTAAASSFFLCAMADRQDIQKTVLEEIDRVFGGSDRDITFQDTVELKYLERCIMETLRMFPPVPVIARELRKDIPLASTNVLIPANCTVVIGTYKLHRCPDVFPDPDVFDPDNFLPEKCSSRHYYSFIPFSAGPRSCVGRKYAMLKLKILLAHVLRKYRVLPGKPMKDWVLQADIILKRTDGFKIRLEPRNRPSQL